jgi:hypothetical protein
VRQQPAANLFLIRVGQAGDFRHGYFECPDHFAIISHRRACLHPGDSWRARRGFEAPDIQIS